MAEQRIKTYSVPIPAELDAQVRADMVSAGFNSLSEYVRDALRARLERSARRRLEANLARAAERGDYGDAETDVWAWVRDLVRAEGASGEPARRKNAPGGAPSQEPVESGRDRLEHALHTLRAHEGALRERGVIHAAVFGSTVRGEATAGSDVDILVDIDPEIPAFTVFDFVGLARYLRSIVPGADVVERTALKPRIRERILREAIDAF